MRSEKCKEKRKHIEHPEEMPLGFLINHLSKFFRDYTRVEAEKMGIPDNFRAVMFHLRRESGLSQLELASRCQVKPSSMSITLRNMEEQGYILREVDANDRRLIHVSLTEAGIAKDDELIGIILQTESLFCSGLSEEEIPLIKSLLAKVYGVTVGKEEKPHDETI